jgi:hypothetical protein
MLNLRTSVHGGGANPATGVGPAPRDSTLTEGLLRVFALLTLGVFIYNVTRVWWADPSRVTLLLLVLTETFTLGLVLFARRALIRDLSPLAIAATVYAAGFFVLFRYGDTDRLAPEWLGASLQLAGLAWQVLSSVAGRARPGDERALPGGAPSDLPRLPDFAHWVPADQFLVVELRRLGLLVRGPGGAHAARGDLAERR